MSPSISNYQTGAVLMLGDIFHAHEEFAELSNLTEVIHINQGDRKTFKQKCSDGTFDNVKAISRTVESAQFTGVFDADLINALPASVKFISHNGAGYDQIDVGACEARGISVSNTPGSVDGATADITMFLMLGAMRQAWIAQTALRNGDWRGAAPLGIDPRGKTLGILGMGGIGTAVAQRARPFGFNIQYYNRNPVKDLSSKFSGMDNLPKLVGFEELLRSSDVISVHLPLTQSTRHIISRKQYAMMKDGVIIVNTARGAVLDEEALIEVLETTNKVWSVGLDVFENEPVVSPKLLANTKVMLLPHMGTATRDTQKRMEIQVIDNVINALQNNSLLNPVSTSKK